MLKTTLLFVSLLTETVHLHPELTQDEIIKIAEIIAEEPEFKGIQEIHVLINNELKHFTPVLLKAKKVAYQQGLRPGGVK